MRPFLLAVLLLTASVAFAAEQDSAGLDPVGSARLEYHEGKFDSALATLGEAEKRGSLSGQAIDLRGCILMEQGKYDQAIAAFEAAHSTDAWMYAHLHVGEALLRQKKWDEARASFLKNAKESNVLVVNEHYRYGIFIASLGAKNEENALKAYQEIAFPTESPAYYYAQAAWDFAHGRNRDAQNWIKRASDLFSADKTAWFARPLYDFGWLKTKPQFTTE